MINITKAKQYTSPDTYKKIENYNKAAKSKLKYICHHKDEIINKKTGKAIYNLNTLEKTPLEDIIVNTENELRGEGKYFHLPYKKMVFLTTNEHSQLHGIIKLKIRDAKGKTKKPNITKYSTKGITELIKKHYNYNITRNQLMCELAYYSRHGFVSWKIKRKKTKSQIAYEVFLKEFNLKSNDATVAFTKTQTYRNLISNKNCMDVPQYKYLLNRVKELYAIVDKLKKNTKIRCK